MSDGAEVRRRRPSFTRRRTRAGSMTMMEHLRELRTRLIFSLAAFLVVSVVAFFFYDPVLDLITRPLCDLPRDLLGPQGCRLIFVKVIGGFMFRLKVTALVGIIFSTPVWLYQLWAFIVPGLTRKERRYAIPFVLTSVVLFALGTFLAYQSLPTGLRILFAIAGEDLVAYTGAEEYLNFIGLMFLGFGLMFELPLVLFFLGLAEVISVDQLRRQRKAALVGIVALSAIITPSQDPYTMLILAGPIYLLYEVTILVLKIIMRRRAKAS
ncbi:MAG TPA: twin-arginine translocase subunit TatC [Actinomycetota bacterium]|nr:twin-arginine translocase subunit TatC [Actinomycetota bacterium]